VHGSSIAEINSNLIRYNDWPGCIEQEGLEVTNNISEEGKTAIREMGRNPILVPNVDGFISQRIISLIINEAYFTEGDGVSTRKDIDTAMKLGTNYPYGPFEWSKLIGIKKIASLLNKMMKSNEKYTPCNSLIDASRE
jgi:3-hydroxybutyryl-CoA dehydrogenase